MATNKYLTGIISLITGDSMVQHRFRYLKIGVLVIVCFFSLIPDSLRSEGNSAWLQYKQAAMLFKQKAQSAEIVPLIREVQNNTSDSVLFGRAAFLMSTAFERNGQPEQAIMELQGLGKSKWNLPKAMLAESWLRIGSIYSKLGKIKQAKSYFNKVLEDKDSPFIPKEAILGLAWIAADEDQWTTCDSLLSQLAPDEHSETADERITILRARQAIAKDQPEKAIEMLKDSQSETGLFFLAEANEMAGNRIMAVSVYKKLQDLFPNRPIAKQALFNAAEVFMRAGDWLAARSELKRLLNSGLGSPDAIHYRLGWINLNLKQLDDALAEFRSPYSSENAGYFKYMEAECLRRQGADDPQKLDKSIILFHNIASVDLHSPLAPLAKLKAALTEMEKGDSSGALVSLKQFLKLYPKDEMTPAVYFLLGANETPTKGQWYFDQIIQQTQKSQFFDVSYFALQNHDFNKGDYRKVITRNTSMPQQKSSDQLTYWQRANHLLIGESAYFLKHYPQAVAEYHLAEDASMDDLTEKAMIGKAWCKLQLKGTDSALVAFRALRKNIKGQNKILVDYGFATVQFLRQDYMEALKAYPVSIQTQDAPEFVPLVVNSLFRSGQCYYRLESYIQAIETWDKLAKEFPHSSRAVEALSKVADVYFRANHFSEADSVYQFIIANYPDDPVAVESGLKLAQSAYNASNYEEAIARFKSFIEKYPDNEKNKEALEGLQLSYYQLGQVDQASETLQKVVEQTSNSDLAIDARYRIAMNHYQEQNYQQAIEEFKEILTLYPNSTYAVDAQFALSKCYLALEDYQASLDELSRFVQYFPESSQVPEAYFLLGVGYYQMESYLSAVDYFKKVIQDYIDSEYYGPALKNSAWCYDHLQEKQKAIQAFLSYLEKYPSAEDAQTIQLQIGRLMLETRKTQDGLKRIESLQSAENLEVSMEATFRLGMYYLSIENASKAKQVFKTAVSRGAGDNYYRLSALAQLAAIYENEGDNQNAIDIYELLASSTNEESWTSAAKQRIDMLKLAQSQQ